MKSTQRRSDLQAMSPDQLTDELLNLKKEQFNLRFQGATGQLENVARVHPGRIMFEIDGVAEDIAREALRLGAAKLPVRTRFIQRIAD